MRFTPKPITALVVFVIYLAVFYGIWVINGIENENIGEDASTILKWYVAPLAGGAVVLLVAVTTLGWWRPVISDTERRPPPRWMWLTPIVMLAVAAVFLVSKHYTGVTGQMVIYLAIGSIGVGFCEETMTRGVLLTGFRARMTEAGVWFWTSLLFGALHLPNWFFGLGPEALRQTMLAFCVGSTFYIMRRLTGSLVRRWWSTPSGTSRRSSVPRPSPSPTSRPSTPSSASSSVVLVLREKGLRIPVVSAVAPATGRLRGSAADVGRPTA